MNTTTTVTVTGMTCGHCVQSVQDELAKVPRVADVRVDLASGKVQISSSDPIDPVAVAEAIAEAGYEVSS